MLKRYENFLKEFDKILENLFDSQKDYVQCQRGCADCCKKGDYPFSRLEMEYLMAGFQSLSQNVKDKIRKNIANINNKKSYTCPFLINDLCSLYDRRSLTCRVHGLAYLKNGVVKLPECANFDKNYSKVFNRNTKETFIENPIEISLRVDDIFQSELAEKYELEEGEIRSLVDWFKS